jgi:hypothetical protein
VWLSTPHLSGLTTRQAWSRLTSLLCEMWRQEPAVLPTLDPRYTAVAHEQYSSPLYPRPAVYLPPAVILAFFGVRDVERVSWHSESVRFELLSDQHALCLRFSFEDALLAILD